MADFYEEVILALKECWTIAGHIQASTLDWQYRALLSISILQADHIAGHLCSEAFLALLARFAECLDGTSAWLRSALSGLHTVRRSNIQ